MDTAFVGANEDAEVHDTTMHSFFCSPPDINLPLTPPTAAENQPASGLASIHDGDEHIDNAGLPPHASEIQLLVPTSSQAPHRDSIDSKGTVRAKAREEGSGCSVKTAEHGSATLHIAALDPKNRYEPPIGFDSSTGKDDTDPSDIRASQSIGSDGGGFPFHGSCNLAVHAVGRSVLEHTAGGLDLAAPPSGSFAAACVKDSNGLAATGRRVNFYLRALFYMQHATIAL